jgi:anti-sigma regulatory factor (Ser/Thr protein kinase)
MNMDTTLLIDAQEARQQLWTAEEALQRAVSAVIAAQQLLGSASNRLRRLEAAVLEAESEE